MASKITLSFFLIFSSCVFLGFSSEPGKGGTLQMPCLQNLLPCKPYLQGTVQPPSVCCVPLKDMVVHQTQCLCSVFTNPDLMKSLNVTLEGALHLAKTCGASVDMSVCKNGTAPSSSPGSPATPSPPTPVVTPPKSAADYGMTHFGGSGLVAAIFVGLIISIF